MQDTRTAGKERLRAVLTGLADGDHAELERVLASFEHRRYRTRNFIIREGEQERWISFLVTGAVKVGINRDGDEKILDFWFDNSFFSSYSSLLTGTPSRVYIQAIADTTVLRIRADIITSLYKTSLTANRIGRIMAEQLFLRKTQREIDFLTKSAAERYSDLLARCPEAARFVPLHQIASYLGIRPESLSRIRRSLSL